MRAITTTGTRGFLQYLKTRQPRVYHDLQMKLHSKRVTLGDLDTLASTVPTLDIATTAPPNATPPTLADTFKGIITDGAQAYLTKIQLDMQKKLMDLQLERARRGLPPQDIDPSAYGLAPTARVGLTSDTTKLLMYGGLGLLAVLLVGPMLRGARR